MDRSTVSIAGRRYVIADLSRRTVRMDHFMSSAFRKVGLDRVTPTAEEMEDPKLILIRLHQKLITSGQTCVLLSAFLLPEGSREKDWRPDTASIVQEWIESADTEEDRATVNRLAMEVITGFFGQGLRSLVTSLGSLSRALGLNEESPSDPMPESLATTAGSGPV